MRVSARRLVPAFFVLSSFLSCAAVEAQKTINVGPGRTYTTIQPAIDAAANGDTVLVDAGTYLGDLTIANKGVTLVSASGAAVTTLDGNGLAGPVVTISGTVQTPTPVLDGFTIQNGGVSASGLQGGVVVTQAVAMIRNNVITRTYCAGITASTAAPTILNNQINRTLTAGCTAGEGLGSGVRITGSLSIFETASLTGNTIELNTASVAAKADTGGGGAVNVTNTPGVYLYANILRNNSTTGYGGAVYVATTPALYVLGNLVTGNKGISGGFDIVVPGSSVGHPVGYITNNTIAGNSGLSAGANVASDLYIGGNLAQYQIANNIIVGYANGQSAVNCGVAYASQTLTPLVFDHNDIYSVATSTNTPVGGACSSPAGTYGNISVDPKFILGTSAAVSAGTADFHLTSASPALDAGNNAVVAGVPGQTYAGHVGDLDGSPRQADATGKGYVVVDMGAYELGGVQDSNTNNLGLDPSTYTPAAGAAFSLTASLGYGALPAPTGSLTFYEDNNALGTIAITGTPSGGTLSLPNGLTAGLHVFLATYPGSSCCSPAVSVPVYVRAGGATSGTTMTTLTSSLNPSNLGQSVTFTANVTSAAGVPTGTVYFADGGATLGSQAVDASGNAAFMTSSLAAGTRSITASYVPSGTFVGSSASLTQVVNAGPAAQTITFPTPAPAYVGTTVTLMATASSGQPVTYTLVSGPATLNGSVLTFTGVGTVVVEADQAGNGSYLPASLQDTVAVTVLTEPVGTLSPTLYTTITFATAGTLGGLAVLTQGAPNLDFTGVQLGTVNAPLPTCSMGASYAAGQTCLVAFRFKPTTTGQRLGGFAVTTATGAPLATAYVPGFGTGPQIAYLPAAQSVVNTAVGRADVLAIDGAGNLFVGAEGTGLFELTAAGGYSTVKPLNSSFTSPQGIAVDGAGNLFVPDGNTQTVTRLFAATGYTTTQTIGSGWSYPSGVAVDASGNVFVSDRNLHAVKEFTAASGYAQSVTLGGTAVMPGSLVLDASGNLFVLDLSNSSVHELSAASNYGTETKLTSGSTFAVSLAIDANANLYIGNSSNTVQELLAAGGYASRNTLTTAASFTGMAFDGKGNLFGLDYFARTLSKLDVSDAPTLTFASTPVGQASKDSPQSVTLFNNGNANLVFSSSANGVNPNITAGFSLGAGTTCPQITTAIATVPLAPGASCVDSITFKPVAAGAISGALTLTDNNLNGSAVTQAIPLNGSATLIPTTATLTVSPASAAYGVPIVLTATVTSAFAGFPTGTVTFLVDGVIAGFSPLTGYGFSTLSLSGLSVGTHQLNCIYQGDSTFATSMCTPITVTVSIVTTSLTLGSSANPSPALTQVTFTAKLTSAGLVSGFLAPVVGAPVVFTVDGKVAGTVTTDANGSAAYLSAGFAPGTHTVAAAYAGDAGHTASAAPTLNEIVVPNATTTTLIGAPNPGTQNQPVTLVASVAASTGTTAPVGSVQFLDNGVVLAVYPLQPPAQGTVASATLVTSSLTAGVHVLNAIFLPANTSFLTSTAAPLTLTINAQDFKLTTAQPSVTIQTEHHASVGVTLTSIGGLSGRFLLACGSLPDSASCTWAGNNVYLPGNGSVSTTVKIDTDVILNFKSAAETPARPGRTWAGTISLALLLPIMLMSRRRGRRLRALLPAVLLGAMFCGLAGCGNKYPAHTAPGTYTVPITATGTPDGGAAPLTRTVNLTLIVTP